MTELSSSQAIDGKSQGSAPCIAYMSASLHTAWEAEQLFKLWSMTASLLPRYSIFLTWANGK